MKYLLLVYEDEQWLTGLLPDERTLLAEASRASDDWLRTSGRLLAGAPLPAAHTVATVCVQDAQITLAAGPLAEATMQLCAFYFIDAQDLNDAIQVAAQLPQAQRGLIEVRPISE